MKKYILTLLIVFSCLFLQRSYSQPIDNQKNITTSVSKTLFSEKDTITQELSKEHKKKIEEAVKTTSYGDVIWTYFGEIILGGIGLLLLYIRVTIKNFFVKVYNSLVNKEKTKHIYTNEDIKKLGKLNDDINNYLTTIKKLTKGKRVLLYQFSNGSHFFSSIPVLRMTVTNYSEGDFIKPTDNVFNYVTAKEIIHQILNDEYLEILDTNTEYCGYTSYLRFSKFKNATLIRVNVSDNYCGVIEIIEPEEFDLPQVRSYCYSIGHLFEGYNREKQEEQTTSI